MSPISASPNVLLIFSDQQHWQAMGCIDPFFDTPNLDAFAKESIVFENAFCTTPQCSPSRSTLLTGLYPSATGVMGNVGNAGGNPLKIPTIGTELQTAGYRTGYFGKWHLGEEPAAIAGWEREERGINDPQAEKNARQFLKSTSGSDAPFALMVSINNPHDIYGFRKHEPDSPLEDVTLPESWEYESFENKPQVQRQFMTEDQGTVIEGAPKDEWKRYHDCYREKVRLFDQHVGRILDALDRSGHRDDTLVILTSDHGDMDTHHRLIFKGPFMYEHLIRVPLMIRMPKDRENIPPGRINDVHVVNTDLVPTLRDLCGLPAKKTHGLSLAPFLTGSGDYVPREYVVGQYHGKQAWVNPMRMIRTKSFKFIRHLNGREELYNLQKDPYELENLAGKEPFTDVGNVLGKKLDQWIKRYKDPFYSLAETDRNGVPLSNP